MLAAAAAPSKARAGGQRGGRAGGLAAADPVQRGGRPGHARQPHRAAKAREQAELDLRQADLRLHRHHPQAAGQRHLQAAAQRRTVEGHHAGHVQVLQRAQRQVLGPHRLRDGRRGLLEHGAELGDVGADDEHRLRAAHQHAAQAVVAGQLPHGVVKLLHGGAVELVDAVALAVEAQFDEAVGEGDQLDAQALEHRALLGRSWGWMGRPV